MGGHVSGAVMPQLELQAPEIVTAAAILTETAQVAVTLTGTETELGTEPGTEVASGRVFETVAVSCRVGACVRVSAGGQPALVIEVLTASVTGRVLHHGAAQHQAVVLSVQLLLQPLACWQLEESHRGFETWRPVPGQLLQSWLAA